MTGTPEYVDKGALFGAPRLPEEDVEIPRIGTIRVRGLSRVELLLAGKLSDQGVATMERRMLCYGMVHPKVTEDEVQRWQESAPAGEIQPIIAVVNRLSGIGKDVQKEAYKSLRDAAGA